jgi:hypothetical protein
MIKFLFFDNRELEVVEGFVRELGHPVKHPANPLFIADQPWENGNMQLYGSVVKAPGKPFQVWYSVVHDPWWIYLCYAESEDGMAWTKPLFDIHPHNGQKTNIVLASDVHGPAVIYDEADPRPDWKYKMVAGAAPSNCICAFRSPDGIHWYPIRRHPLVATPPDCPMSMLRLPDGRYAVYHRVWGKGRRVNRSESVDLVFTTGEPRLVFEPGPGDPPQLQFYGMGSALYGSYEIGTLWAYHTRVEDFGGGKMRGYQEAEFVYSRSGYAWHRAAQGQAFIPHGQLGDWDEGNLQCASSPVFLENEIRYFYAGTNMTHQTHWELQPQKAGLGMARLEPDRFIALATGESGGALLTRSFRPRSEQLLVNAKVEPDGCVRVAALNEEGQPVAGLAEQDCEPVRGDSLGHQVRWRNGKALPMDIRIRLRVAARRARIYSVSSVDPGEKPAYSRFEAVVP